MSNLPAIQLKERQALQRKITMTVDIIGQFSLRAQTAEFYGLYRVANNAIASKQRHEAALTKYQAQLEKLGG